MTVELQLNKIGQGVWNTERLIEVRDYLLETLSDEVLAMPCYSVYEAVIGRINLHKYPATDEWKKAMVSDIKKGMALIDVMTTTDNLQKERNEFISTLQDEGVKGDFQDLTNLFFFKKIAELINK